MLKMKLNGKEYKLKFGFKSFKNSEILQEVVKVQNEIKNKTENENGEENGDDIAFLGDVLNLTSRLVLVALQKYNEEFRVDFSDANAVKIATEKTDDLIDDYMEEEDSLSIMELFQSLVGELFNNGFLSKKPSENLEKSLTEQDATIIPMDHLTKAEN